MANEEQLTLLRKGVKAWNEWRKDNPGQEIKLGEADLQGANLQGANLRGAQLQGADLLDANIERADLLGANLLRANLLRANLQNAQLGRANLERANLREANLEGALLFRANLEGALLWGANLEGADLQEANLGGANLRGADLQEADLQEANLERANLERANLEANLERANLQEAQLRASQVLYANFSEANLTGACIADWQIGSSTTLDCVICDFIFRTILEDGSFSGRLPVDPESTFAPGEFTQRFQIIASALETIDITFTEGIDWQAFFQSFQELRRDLSSENISIQGMERKGESFIVRLEVDTEADKAAIETQVKQLYATQLAALEAQYEERLQLQSQEIAYHRQTQSSLLHIVQTMAEKDSINQTFHGPVGNVAGTNSGSMTAYITQNSSDISSLLTALREIAQQFPDSQKDEALMELEDLEDDLKQPERQEPKRLGKRLQRLLAAGTAAATVAGGAATFSGNLNEFTSNVLELGEKIGLSIEDIQPDQAAP
jgi:uncharacterized protein YjbI with pentapeptide repeats